MGGRLRMENLGATGYSIKSKYIDGPIGVRHVVKAQSTGDELLADVVSPDDDQYLAIVCRNALRTRRWTEDPAVANVLEAGLLADGRYFQVLEMSPCARPLAELRTHLAEPQL